MAIHGENLTPVPHVSLKLRANAVTNVIWTLTLTIKELGQFLHVERRLEKDDYIVRKTAILVGEVLEGFCQRLSYFLAVSFGLT